MNVKLQERLHFVMAFVGGFLGGYALVMRGGNFGSAQTGNLMELVIDLTNGDLRDVLFRLGAAVIFASGIAAAWLCNHKTGLPMRRLTPVVEALLLAVAAALPAQMDPVAGLYPIFFLSAFQWGTFSGTEEFSCATIFSTNNLRQCVQGFLEYRTEGSEKGRRRFRFYGITVLCFLIGTAYGCVPARLFGPVSALFAYLPLLCAFLLAGKEGKA